MYIIPEPMGSAHKTKLLLSVFLATAFAQTAAADAHARQGTYFGIELGVAAQERVRLDMRDNDVPTRCDQVLREHSGATSGFFDLTAESLKKGGPCERGQDVWSNRHDVDIGFIGGLQAGYLLGNYRAEVEYLYRSHAGDDRKPNQIEVGSGFELVKDEQGLDALRSHSVFANLYYDFIGSSRFTPYVGAGIGFSKIDYVFDAIYARNINPNFFRPNPAGPTPPEAGGTTTDTSDELSDEVFGWQFIIGSDYAIDEHWSIGLKLRYQRFNDPEDSDQWDRLRTHDSVIADDATLDRIRSSDPSLADFDPTVTYHVEVENIEVWTASLNLKYRF